MEGIIIDVAYNVSVYDCHANPCAVSQSIIEILNINY